MAEDGSVLWSRSVTSNDVRSFVVMSYYRQLTQVIMSWLSPFLRDGMESESLMLFVSPSVSEPSSEGNVEIMVTVLGGGRDMYLPSLEFQVPVTGGKDK
jgi:hypothetical protein